MRTNLFKIFTNIIFMHTSPSSPAARQPRHVNNITARSPPWRLGINQFLIIRPQFPVSMRSRGKHETVKPHRTILHILLARKVGIHYNSRLKLFADDYFARMLILVDIVGYEERIRAFSVTLNLINF